MYRMEIFFGVAKISVVFVVCLIFQIFSFCQTVDAGSKPTHDEKIGVPGPNSWLIIDSAIVIFYYNTTYTIFRA